MTPAVSPAGTPGGSSAPTRIPVTPLGGPSYDVVVGRGLLGELASLVRGATRVALVHPAVLGDLAAAALDRLRAAGYLTEAVAVPAGEAAKSLAVAEQCWEVLGRRGLTREDAVVGLGGGAVTDLAGFVAATWLRGIRVVQVPTTLLGMVDAAVGGKTGINTGAGKNLVGAFHQPAGVLCDLDALATLPPEEFASGLAEVVKVGFIADPELLRMVEADPTGRVETRLLVERSVRVKAAVVSADPREAGRREVLNYGHTLGHALERVEGYAWRHGAAVSVGLVYAAALSRLAGRLDAPTAERHRTVLAAVGLPTGYPAAAWPALHAAMRVDKKARGHRLRFVVLDGLARPGVLEDPDAGLLMAAYAEIAHAEATA